jgi:hypothetical protein
MTDFWDALKQAFGSWHHAKVFVEHSTSISHDTLHLIAGMLISLVVATLLRRPIASWVPWLATFAIILFNEAADLWIEIWPDHARQLGEGAKDIAVTMAIPTILMLAVRLNPKLFRPSR